MEPIDLGLLIIRLAVGLGLAAHGAQKLFGWFGGHGLAGTGGFMESLGFRPGRRNAALAGLGELGGGLLLALGLLTPLAAAVIVAVMLTAAASAHAGRGFFVTNGGWELPFVLASVAVAIAFTGPGEASVDYAVGLDLDGWQWGIGAIVLGLVMGGIRLATRSTDLAVAPEPVDLTADAAADRDMDADATIEQPSLDVPVADDRIRR
jgi:putative oxidoreductase